MLKWSLLQNLLTYSMSLALTFEKMMRTLSWIEASNFGLLWPTSRSFVYKLKELYQNCVPSIQSTCRGLLSVDRKRKTSKTSLTSLKPRKQGSDILIFPSENRGDEAKSIFTNFTPFWPHCFQRRMCGELSVFVASELRQKMSAPRTCCRSNSFYSFIICFDIAREGSLRGAHGFRMFFGQRFAQNVTLPDSIRSSPHRLPVLCNCA